MLIILKLNCQINIVQKIIINTKIKIVTLESKSLKGHIKNKVEEYV